jgi:uncharacterized phiE125 gp8 family phage protein
MALKLVIPPVREPLSLALAKTHLRVDFSSEDAIIQGHISAARRYAEGYLNRALLAQAYELWLDAWPAGNSIELPMPPLQSVEQILYYDSDDAEHTLPVSDYYVNSKGLSGKVVLRNGKSWPGVRLRSSHGIVVQFVAGYYTHASVVNTEGTSVTRVNGDAFQLTWPAGRIVTINNATYLLSQVTTASALVVGSTAGTQTGVALHVHDIPETMIDAMILHIKSQYDDYSPQERERMERARDALLSLDRVMPV